MEFKQLTGVAPEILRAVEEMGFTAMTEVQEKAIPVMMSGREIIAKADRKSTRLNSSHR